MAPTLWNLQSLLILAALGLAYWVVKKGIPLYLERFIGHQFDQRIEVMKSELRTAEAQFADGLKTQQDLVNDLRSGPLSLSSEREKLLFAKRMQACEAVWLSVVAMRKYYVGVELISHLNMKMVLEKAHKDKEFRNSFSKLFAHMNLLELDFGSAKNHIPFLPTEIVNAYQGLSLVVTGALVEIVALTNGLPPDALSADRYQPVVQALARLDMDVKELAEKFGSGFFNKFLLPLEDCVVVAIRELLMGRESDVSAVASAKSIVSLINPNQYSQLSSFVDQLDPNLKQDSNNSADAAGPA